jgi:hypothetical protein
MWLEISFFDRGDTTNHIYTNVYQQACERTIGELPQDQSNDRAHDTKYIKTRMSTYAFFETDEEKEKTPKSGLSRKDE